ncbi:response regulator [Amphritea sp. 1_MG-2023]|uniref:response regulator n=1 Tax=Amphritea sp. 1_MG-2023 TaxID=3062670 RepID=UPI0026E394B7|nr:response regulator [Amphritea sp. 1_MG-2023]MDO6563669.1 response regulator [Amphritea sp. 1_MG-2023]
MLNKKPRILIVDDEPSTIELLCALLDASAELSIAITAEKALALAQAQLPDLILLDIELPDGSGFDVCQQLRRASDTAHIPIIFLTAFTDIMFEARAFDVGAVDFITKPASPFRVIMRANAHLKEELKISRDHIRQIAQGIMPPQSE